MERVRFGALLNAGNVGCGSSAALLPIGAKRHDFVRHALTRGSIYIRVSPRIVGNDAAFEIRPVPLQGVSRPLHQPDQTVAGGRITAHVEIVEIESAFEAFDLNPRRLYLRLAEIIEHPGADDRHDQSDDGDDHEYFHEREACLAPAERCASLTPCPGASHAVFLSPKLDRVINRQAGSPK